MENVSGAPHVNELGHLLIGGCDAVELVQEFGSPLYVLDEQVMRARCRAYVQAFSDHYPHYRVIYAGKALLTTAICRIVEQEGLGLDVVSGGELYTAMHADFPADRLYFHGNNKSHAELQMAVDAGVHRIVVDNLYELELLSGLAAQKGRHVDVLLRVAPGVQPDTHSHIQTGQEDTKFGFDLRQGIHDALAVLMDATWIRLRGFHVHIGSQITDAEPYRQAVEVVFSFLDAIRERYGYTAEEVNLGGGLGIPYVPGEPDPDPYDFVKSLTSWVKDEATRRTYPLPMLLIEPGRSIVGTAGTTLYTIGSIKTIPGIRTYAAVDGGMADNPRVAMYGARYDAVVANKATAAPSQTVTIAGKCCESGDMLIWDFHAPPLSPGDILAVKATGAYNYSMASHYNRLPKPAMVLVSDGKADLIVRRETYEDLVRFDVMPKRLEKPRVQGA